MRNRFVTKKFFNNQNQIEQEEQEQYDLPDSIEQCEELAELAKCEECKDEECYDLPDSIEQCEELLELVQYEEDCRDKEYYDLPDSIEQCEELLELAQYEEDRRDEECYDLPDSIEQCEELLELMEYEENFLNVPEQMGQTERETRDLSDGFGKIVDCFQKQCVKTPYDYAKKILSGGQYRYLDSPKESNLLYQFNGRYWECITDKELLTLAYSSMSVEARKEEKNIDKFCKNIVNFLKYECRQKDCKEGMAFKEKDFINIQNRIVFKNCIYDVRKQKIMNFNSSKPYYMGIDAEYIEEDEPTPMYDKLKWDATDGDPESMEMFDIMLAYLMIPNRNGKCFFVMASARDSGKSIFGQFIESIYEGERAKTIDPTHLSGRFAFSRAGDATLFTCLEMSTDRLKKAEVAQIKKITGDKKVRAEAKYKDEQNVEIRFKLLLATNGGLYLPVNVCDDAFYRRVIVIPFIKSTPLDKLIADLDKKLQKEKSAILSKVARKIGNYIKKDGGFVFPESELSRKIKDSWSQVLHFEDVFVSQHLEYTGKSEDAVSMKDVYIMYQEFFNENREGITNACMYNKKQIKDYIMGRYMGVGYSKRRKAHFLIPPEGVSGEYCLVGLKWKMNFTDDE